jgi:very-short-patch-repair endonuclease
MDFLLLLSNRDRVVLEVDGKQHYANGDIASPQLYADMVSEDRKLRLLGYEVYRFGGYELFDPEKGKVILNDFFMRLFEKHGLVLR